MRRSASAARGVRKVISAHARPPAASARASGTASSGSSITMTGTMRAARSALSVSSRSEARWSCQCHRFREVSVERGNDAAGADPRRGARRPARRNPGNVGQIGAPERVVGADARARGRRTRSSDRGVDATARPRARARPRYRPAPAGQPICASAVDVAAHEREDTPRTRTRATAAAAPSARERDDRRHDADAHLRRAVQRDVDERMTNVRIAKRSSTSLANASASGASRLRHDLVEHGATKEARRRARRARVAHRLKPGEQRDRHDDRVRAVQQANLSLAIRPNVRRDDDRADRSPGKPSRARNAVVALDREQRVRLAGREQLVAIAEHSLETLDRRRAAARRGRCDRRACCRTRRASSSQCWNSRAKPPRLRASGRRSRENRRRCRRSARTEARRARVRRRSRTPARARTESA